MFKSYLLISILVVITSACFAREPASSAQLFWKEFRQAVIEENYKKLDTLTQFPLAVHGETDFSPIRKIDKSKFQETFKKVLAQSIIGLENGKTTELSLRDIVVKTSRLEKKHILAPDKFFRVSDLEFEYKENTWKLFRTYLPEE